MKTLDIIVDQYQKGYNNAANYDIMVENDGSIGYGAPSVQSTGSGEKA